MIDGLWVILIMAISFHSGALYMLHQYFTEWITGFCKDHTLRETAKYLAHERECKAHHEWLGKLIQEKDQSISSCFNTRLKVLEDRVNEVEKKTKKSERPISVVIPEPKE